MKRFALACICVVVHAATASGGAQSVYPTTGTTIYDPDRAWNGYTVVSRLQTAAPCTAPIASPMRGSRSWERRTKDV
jgi:hypothetical protein